MLAVRKAKGTKRGRLHDGPLEECGEIVNPPEQVGIRRQSHPARIEPEITLEPDPHAPALHDRNRIGPQLRRADSPERLGCAGGTAPDEHAHLLKVGLRA